MALYEYSIRPVTIVGKAQAHDLDCSYKDLTQVMRAISGQPVRKAYRTLELAMEGTHAIRYTKFAKGCGHRSELGGKTGRYPKKECRLALKVLKNAAANALAQGLEEDSLYVSHAAAYKQAVFRRYRQFWVSGTVLGYGKNATWANYETAHMEVIVSGKVDEKSEFSKAKSKSKNADKNKPAKKTDAPAEKKTQAKAEKPAAPKTESPAPQEKSADKAEKPAKKTEQKTAPKVTIDHPAPSPVKHETK